MVALTNETQTMLSFPRIFKFNAVIYYPFIIILQHRKKKCHVYLSVKYLKNIIIFILCVKIIIK